MLFLRCLCGSRLKELGVVESLKDRREDVWFGDVAIYPVHHILEGKVRVFLFDVAIIEKTPIDDDRHGGKVNGVVPKDLA